MDQEKTMQEQNARVRRRYSAAPAPDASAAQEAAQQLLPQKAEAAPAVQEQPAARRRADRRRSETAKAAEPLQQPIAESPAAAAPQPQAGLPAPETAAADAGNPESGTASPLSAYDKRNTVPQLDRDKHTEGKSHRFSDRHLTGEEDQKPEKKTGDRKKERPGKAERSTLKQSREKHERRKQEEAETAQPALLTASDFDRRLSGKGTVRKRTEADAKPAKENKPPKAAKKPKEAMQQEAPAAEAAQEDTKPAAPPKPKFQYPSQYTSQKRRSAAHETDAAQLAPEEKAEPADAGGTSANGGEQPPAEKPPLRKRLPYYIGIALCTVVLIVSGGMLLRYYSQIWRADRASGQLRDLYTPGSTAQTQPETTAAPAADGRADTATGAIGETSETIGSETADVNAAATAAPPPAMQAAANGSAQIDRANADAFLAAWPKKYPGNEQMLIQERFAPLRHQNKDIVGWLNIEGVVDEPVFQRDNSFYLTHDATGAKNPTGALFLDEKCNLRTVPMMTLIHGHNMKEGAMFGSLKKYKVKDASFYRQHPFITFDSLYETAQYVIFCVAEVNIVPGNTHYFPFWHRFNFTDETSFNQFVSLAKEYSRFKVDIDVEPGDRLLTLATCASEDSNLRLIIMARMVRENEDTIMLANKIYSAVAK